MPHGRSLFHSNQLILINFVAVLVLRKKLSPFSSHLSECYWHLGEDLTDRLTFHNVIVARCQQCWWKEHRWHENQTERMSIIGQTGFKYKLIPRVRVPRERGWKGKVSVIGESCCFFYEKSTFDEKKVLRINLTWMWGVSWTLPWGSPEWQNSCQGLEFNSTHWWFNVSLKCKITLIHNLWLCLIELATMFDSGVGRSCPSTLALPH